MLLDENLYQPIGVLMIGPYSTKPRGLLGSELTFNFPVERIEGTKIQDKFEEQKHVFEGDLNLVDDFITAARELEKRGVSLITTNCGFAALYQRNIANAVSVPVLTSSLILVPMIWGTLKKKQKVGILTFTEKYLSEEHFKAVGWSSKDIPIVLGGVSEIESWNIFLQKTKEGDNLWVNERKMEDSLVTAAKQLQVKDNTIAVLILECTGFSPYAKAIQKETGLPVFDITNLVSFIYHGINRESYPIG
jgi:aspartate/glutamate racemase